jgi:hypothetical protein
MKDRGEIIYIYIIKNKMIELIKRKYMIVFV